MSRREDTDRRPLPDYTYHYEAVPSKSLDGQYPHGRKSTNLNNEYMTDEAIDRKSREQHEKRQRRSKEKKKQRDNETCSRAFAETHDLRAGIRPEERRCRERPRRSECSNKGDKPLPYPLPKSTSFHSEDQDLLFESPLYPNRPARRPSNPYDASSSEYLWNPGPYAQPSARGEASLSSSQLGVSRQNALQSGPPHSSLRRIDTYESTSSLGSLSSIALTDLLDEDYEEYVEVPNHVKVPNSRKKDWRHPFG